MSKTMSMQQKERLIRTYKIYNVVDWIIAIAVIGVPIIMAVFEGLGFEGFSLAAFMYYLGNAPAFVIVPVAIISTGYTVWSMCLYVKIWPIKEIPKGFQYWFDWLLTIALTIYELLIFYIILFAFQLLHKSVRLAPTFASFALPDDTIYGTIVTGGEQMASVDKIVSKMKRQPNGISPNEAGYVLDHYGYRFEVNPCFEYAC